MLERMLGAIGSREPILAGNFPADHFEVPKSGKCYTSGMTAIPNPHIPSKREKVPPLENGDSLTSDEFMRRYEATAPGVKAELIEGIVYMASPVRYGSHGQPHAALTIWLGYYTAHTPGLSIPGDNTTILLNGTSTPQPDLFLLLPPHLGGKAKIDEDDYISGPPALVCEVAASSVNIDLHFKKNIYERNGVAEYLAWRVEDAAVDWFVLRDGKYVAQTPNAENRLVSDIFPGLWLDVPALLKADLPALFKTVDAGVASRSHAEFRAKLARVPSAPAVPGLPK